MANYEGFGLEVGKYKSVEVAKEIFGGENSIQAMMTVEAALARAQAKLGIIPKEASDEINRKCDVKLLDEAEFLRQAEITNHPLVPLIRAYNDICENGAGEYIHFGATSQDIGDTANMILLVQACDVVERKMEQLRAVLAEKAKTYRGLVMMGRTNDQQALPITLGFKMASWVDELDRSIERFAQSRDRIFVGQFAGAVGTMASLEEHGPAVQRELMAELGLGIPKIAWYASRDRLAELASNLCILTCSLGRFSNEVYNASRSEVHEFTEGFKAGRVGSSTMPHKRNPFVSARVVAYARQARSVMVDALTSMESTNERDARPLFMENEVIAKACCLADSALDESIKLMTDLEVHEGDIRRNVELLGGLVFAEAVMMRLSAEFGRLEAHEMVYEVAQKAISQGDSFRQLLLADDKIGGVLTEADLGDMMDPAKYTGLSEYFVDKVLEK